MHLSHLPTYISFCLPTDTLIYLHTKLFIFPTTYRKPVLPRNQPIYLLLSDLLSYLQTFLPPLPTYLLTHLKTYIYVPNCQKTDITTNLI